MDLETKIVDIQSGLSTYSKALDILNAKLDPDFNLVLKDSQISDLTKLLKEQTDLNKKIKQNSSAEVYQSYMNDIASQCDTHGHTLLHHVLQLGAESKMDVYGGTVDNMSITMDLVKQLIACGSKIDVKAIKIAKNINGLNYNKSDFVAAKILGITVAEMNERLTSSSVGSIVNTTHAFTNQINNNSLSNNKLVNDQCDSRPKHN